MLRYLNFSNRRLTYSSFGYIKILLSFISRRTFIRTELEPRRFVRLPALGQQPTIGGVFPYRAAERSLRGTGP